LVGFGISRQNLRVPLNLEGAFWSTIVELISVNKIYNAISAFVKGLVDDMTVVGFARICQVKHATGDAKELKQDRSDASHIRAQVSAAVEYLLLGSAKQHIVKVCVKCGGDLLRISQHILYGFFFYGGFKLLGKLIKFVPSIVVTNNT